MTSVLTRVRSRGAMTPLTAVEYQYNNAGVNTGTVVTNVPIGVVETMTDTVTQPFIPGRTIVNNKMSQSQLTRTARHYSGSQLYSDVSAGGVVRIEGDKYAGDADSIFDDLLSGLPNYNYDSLINLACTSALAGVTKPEISGIVAVKEFRETLHSLIRPVDGIIAFLDRNIARKVVKVGKFSNKRHVALVQQRLKQRIKSSANDLANQHLTIIFGILPFIDDIQGILKALEAIEPLPVRKSSHGTSSSFNRDVKDFDGVIYDDGSTGVRQTWHAEVQRTVSVRAYQLYEARTDLMGALGLNVENVPLATFQTVPLSFVVDWFFNVSKVISALTPRSDVSYLASGYTVTVVDACTFTANMTVYRKGILPGWTGSWNGASLQRVSVTKTRVPANLYDHIGLHLKSNMHRDVLDTFKIAAGLSLITQRLSGILWKSGLLWKSLP